MKKKKEVQLSYVEFQTFEDLDIHDKKLCDIASEIATKAYADFSGFHVGAAVKTISGEIFSGNNQENSAYPSGLCAERVALYYLKSQQPEAIIDVMAITANSKNFTVEEIISPCGACRQVMAEYQMQQPDHPIKIILFTSNGKGMIIHDVRSLLPFVFTENRLKMK